MKGVNYDAWLEQPYQEMMDRTEKYEQACDSYEESEAFARDYKEWVLGREYTSDEEVFTVDDYRDSAEYEDAVIEYMESHTVDDYRDDYDEDLATQIAEERYERSIYRARGYDA